MRIRFFRPVRNAPGEPSGARAPLLTVRQAFILSTALIIAVVAGLLTFLATASAPRAFLAVMTACASALALLNLIIG